MNDDSDDYAPYVWTPQTTWLTRPDYANLAEFGELHEIIPKSNIPGLNPGVAFQAIMKSLEEYDPDDYVTALPADPIGPFLLGLAMGIRGDWRDGINWLRFDRMLGSDKERNGKTNYEWVRLEIKETVNE